ncbi:MAG: hypothetical protein LBC20_16815 [Planctomycetaceae bacterium]|jgi:nucleoside 2-deoxyribosyltransferase|nr:hypothetical protein [Planctomycetaceae bacterium]
MSDTKCFLCGNVAKSSTQHNNKLSGSNYTDPRDRHIDPFVTQGDIIEFYECPICGFYGVDHVGVVKDKFNDDDKSKLSQLAAERHLHNKTGFILSQEDETVFVNNLPFNKMETLLKDYPQDAIELLDRAFLNLSSYFSHPTDRWKDGYTVRMPSLLFTAPNKIFEILLQFKECGWIKFIGEPISSSSPFQITHNGWQHLRELKKRPTGDSQQAFIAMWFDENRKSFYLEIEKACTDTGYKALRIDNKEHNEKICDQIVAEIRKSRILIADMTGQRGGVYFEAGFASGLGIPVIYMVTQSEVDKIHFDTRQYSHIVYSNENDLYEKLKHRIEATVPITQK